MALHHPEFSVEHIDQSGNAWTFLYNLQAGCGGGKQEPPTKEEPIDIRIYMNGDEIIDMEPWKRLEPWAKEVIKELLAEWDAEEGR